MANTITQWKPCVHINGQITSFSTYRELKKNMRLLLKRAADNTVTVSRSRRGEWGEWFEIWQMCHGEPVIIKEGWM
jgi:hypothetical protein